MPVRLVSQERLPPPLEGYVLLDRLGRGGFGEVWKAEAPGGLLKAIKFVFGDLDAQDDEETRAAEQERKALERVKKIRHPYILSLERYDVIDGQLIIVMELADRNLWDRFRECRGLGMPGIPRDELLKYLDEAAEALDLMNNLHHIQHLDVKPQNLFLVYNHVKVADFGLAKAFEGVRGTVTGGVTPVYAGPETFEGYVSRYTDQYSLAIVFQELLTGTRPFNGANTRQLLMQHLNGTPDLSALPSADRAIIDRALAKKPDQRWPSCTDLVRALKQAGSPALPATTTPAPPLAAESSLPTRLGAADPKARTPIPAAPHTVAATPVDSPAGQSRTVVRQLLPSFAPAAPTGSGGVATPLPALVTPGMAVNSVRTPPAAAASTPPRAAAEAARAPTGRAGPERTGPGVLLPALVVAVGRTGLLAQQKLKAAIRDRFGSLDAAPHVRFLFIDTDPETAAAADPSRDAVLARLNRPHHYLQQDGGPPVEQWMPPGLLYKLPRNPGPAAGVRAFGRLALADHYQAVVQRVRQEIDAFTSDRPLDEAATRTGLGLRTNRPRVYLLAGLAGGTGGGMFLDLAFILKNELRRVGYANPESVGVLFVPAADGATARGPALANAYAALTELAHYHQGKNRYQARFAAREPGVVDEGGPFARCALLQLPRRTDPKYLDRTAGLAARAVFLELFTPAGRLVDAVRAEAADLNREKVPVVQTFGLCRLFWPRPELLAAAARLFARRLLQRWAGKDGGHLRDAIQVWLDEQWRTRDLELEAVVGKFDAAARDILREDPEAVFAAAVEPLRTRSPGAARSEYDVAAGVLEQLVELVGRPDLDGDRSGTVSAALAARQKQIAAAAEKQLSSLPAWLVEQPRFRLAGAEEALAQIEGKLQRTVDGLAGVRATLAREVLEAYARVIGLIDGTGSAGARRPAELVEALRAYPRKRLKLLTLDCTLSVYRALLGGTPEFVRELTFCRSKLSDLAEAVGAAPPGEGAGPGKMILPPGVQGLDGAAALFLGAIPADDALAFDDQIQQDVQKKFKSLVAVCVKPENAAPFQALLVDRAREFLDARLEQADPAAAFFQFQEEGPDAAKTVAAAFEAAAPRLTAVSGRRQTEASILAAPAGPDGDRFRRLAEESLPGVELIPAPLPDDIAFFREYPLLPLAEVPQLGPRARAAYDAQARTDHPPHARADVAWG